MTIEVENESGIDVDESALAEVARHALDALGIPSDAELSILVVDVDRMTQEHVRWMNLPGPTDVMAFPMDEIDIRGAGVTHDPAGGPVMIGDVLLCPEVAARQAAEAGHTTADELALLTTHGVLHLLGYDHEEPAEHAEMFGLQAELLASWRAGC